VQPYLGVPRVGVHFWAIFAGHFIKDQTLFAVRRDLCR